MTPNVNSFTLTADRGLLRQLITDCDACAAFDPSVVPQSQRPPFKTFRAIWDTGATNSVITQKVVDECGLKPIGMKDVKGVHGLKRAETFLVNIRLPSAVAAANVEVTLGDLDDAQMLIGMDIITAGDFAITNVGGKTVFSFQIPSTKTIDFVKSQPKPKTREPSGFRPGPRAKKRRKPRHRG